MFLFREVGREAGGEGVKPLDLNDMFVINSHADLAEMMEALKGPLVTGGPNIITLPDWLFQQLFVQTVIGQAVIVGIIFQAV